MLRPVEISIIPNAGAIFLVPELVMKLFIDNAEDFDDGVYNFIQFVEDKLEPFFSKIGVHYIDELFVEYQLIENDTYEITALREDPKNLDLVEAGFESSKFNFEAGIETVSCSTMFAFLMRVSISAIGSVFILFPLLLRTFQSFSGSIHLLVSY